MSMLKPILLKSILKVQNPIYYISKYLIPSHLEPLTRVRDGDRLREDCQGAAQRFQGNPKAWVGGLQGNDR